MPTYVYAVVNEDGSDGEAFEVMQRMSDPALTQHPETGQAVRRVVQPPHLPGKYTEGATKRTLSNENLARHGFTKYEKGGDGTYFKTAGKQGPDVLSAD